MADLSLLGDEVQLIAAPDINTEALKQSYYGGESDVVLTSYLSYSDMIYSFRRIAKEGRVRKGYLVAIHEPTFGFVFPLNPNTIKIKKDVNFAKSERIGQSSPDLLFMGSGVKEISFSLVLDAYMTDFFPASSANEFANSKDKYTARQRLSQVLAQIELFSYPSNWFFADDEVLFFNDYFPPPKIIFGYGDNLYIEVYCDSKIEIVETNKNLEPLRAKVDLTLFAVDEAISYINRKHFNRKIEKAVTPPEEARWKEKILEYYLKRYEPPSAEEVTPILGEEPVTEDTVQIGGTTQEIVYTVTDTPPSTGTGTNTTTSTPSTPSTPSTTPANANNTVYPMQSTQVQGTFLIR